MAPPQPKFLSNSNLFGPSVDKWAKAKGLMSDEGNLIVLNPASNLSDLVDVAVARSNLGLRIGIDVQGYNAKLSQYAGANAPSPFTLSLLDKNSAASWRTALGLDQIDLTKDINKPVSTAVQEALDLKASKDVATTLTDGLMSADDKIKLYGLVSTSGGGPARFDAPYASTWILPHGLSHIPMVQVFLSNGEAVMTDVVSDETHITVTFAQPAQGYVLAY